jgi:hypothetical protein
MSEQREMFAPPPRSLVSAAVSKPEEARLAALIDVAPLAPFQFG